MFGIRASSRSATARGLTGSASLQSAVHLADFEAVALPQLEPKPGIGLIVIDEIGKMECLSVRFVEAARRALAATVPLLGTVALAGTGFIAEVKRAPGVELNMISAENRNTLPAQLAAGLHASVTSA